MDVVPAGCCVAQLHLLCSDNKESGDPFYDYIRKTITGQVSKCCD